MLSRRVFSQLYRGGYGVSKRSLLMIPAYTPRSSSDPLPLGKYPSPHDAKCFVRQDILCGTTTYSKYVYGLSPANLREMLVLNERINTDVSQWIDRSHTQRTSDLHIAGLGSAFLLAGSMPLMITSQIVYNLCTGNTALTMLGVGECLLGGTLTCVVEGLGISITMAFLQEYHRNTPEGMMTRFRNQYDATLRDALRVSETKTFNTRVIATQDRNICNILNEKSSTEVKWSRQN